MHNLDKRVAALEHTSTRRSYTSMTDEQLNACLVDTSRADWVAAMLERIHRDGGSRLPLRRDGK